jgi:hypothetical protein
MGSIYTRVWRGEREGRGEERISWERGEGRGKGEERRGSAGEGRGERERERGECLP